jgi:3',5'-cyclic AMP phosphodiesterase CpdA
MWRFAHLTDTHLGSVTDGEWNNRFLCTMMPDVMACLKRDLAKLNPDFVLVTGDIASHYGRDSFFAARDFLDAFEIPYYPVGGNHDFLLEDCRGWFNEAFGDRMPGSDTVYSFTHKNLHFCILDPWWMWTDGSLAPHSEPVPGQPQKIAFGGRWAVPAHQLAWLNDDLAQNSNMPAVIAVHYPAIPIPRRLWREGMRDAGHLENGDAICEIAANYPQVKVVLSGHVHMNFIERVNGLTHIVTGSMPEFPTEYRDIVVEDDRLIVNTCPLSDASFAAMSLIEGKEWTAGQPNDRTAVISLK